MRRTTIIIRMCGDPKHPSADGVASATIEIDSLSANNCFAGHEAIKGLVDSLVAEAEHKFMEGAK